MRVITCDVCKKEIQRSILPIHSYIGVEYKTLTFSKFINIEGQRPHIVEYKIDLCTDCAYEHNTVVLEWIKKKGNIL